VRRILLASGGILTVMFVAVVFFLFTTAGFKLLLNFSPENLSAVVVEGNLSRGFMLEDLRITGDGVHLDIDQLELKWQPSGLIGRNLTINRFIVNEILIELMGSTSNTPGGDPDISLPFGIRIDDFKFNNVSLILENSDQVQSIKSISGRIHTDVQRLYIDKLSVLANSYTLNLEGHVDLISIPAYRLNADWSYELADFADIAGETSLSGDTMLSNIITTISAPAKIELNLEAQDLLGDPSWRGTIAANQFDTGNLTSSIATDDDIDITINGSGTLTSMVLEGNINSATKLAIGSNAPLKPDTVLKIENIDLGFTLDAAFPTIDALTMRGNVNLRQSTISANDTTENNLQLDATKIQIDYDDNNYRLTASTGFLLNDEFNGTLQASGRGDMNSLTFDRFSLLLDQGMLTGDFSALRSTDNITVASTANWENLIVPINPQHTAKLTEGKFSLTGQLDDYILTLATSIAIDDKVPVQLSLAATGDQNSIQITPLRLGLDSGFVSGDITVQWVDDLSAKMQLDGENINPGLLLEDWTGKLAMATIISATKSANNYDINIENLDVSGQLKGYPLYVQLQSNIKNNELIISNASITSGTSSALIKGVWGLEKDINWTINSPDLSNFHTDMQGQLEAKGRFSGSVEQPQLSGNIHSAEIRTPWFDVESIKSNFLIDQSGSKGLDIELELTSLVRGKTIIDSLVLDAAGTLNKHQYDIQMYSSLADLKLNGEGAYTELNWQGLTQNLSVEFKDHVWVSDDPFNIKIAENLAELARACLRENATSVCAETAWDAVDGWNAAIDAVDVSYEYINPYLPEGISTSGTALIKLKASQTVAGPLRANASILSNTGSIRFQIDNDNVQEFTLETLSGQMLLENEVLDGHVIIQSANSQLQPLKANITVSPFIVSSMDYADLDMQGQLDWTVNDLSFVSTILPQLDEVSGKLAMNLSADGKLVQPVLAGNLIIEEAGLILPEFGIELSDINLKGQPALGEKFEIAGQAKSGEGQVLFNTEIITQDQNQHSLSATIKGDNFELINTPEVRANANSDLVIELSKDKTSLSGSIEITDALVDLNEIKQSTRLSADMVMADRPLDNKPQSRSEINLYISFKDDIQIKGQGINGNLTGGLRIFSSQNGELLGNGEVNIVNAKYEAYGQDLTIKDGKVIYRNQRLDNPELLITAMRNIGTEVSAGLTVTGFLSDPQVTLISTPSLRDEEILSYIVFGRPLTSLTSGEGTNLIGAATAMGIKNSGFLTKSLYSTFGLDQFELSSDSGGENASLTVGKYITPKIYISYVVGLMESFSTAKIRYNLSKKWSLEAKSSTESMGMDVFYSLEK
jgi:translocation and assembly module TamB